jgi:hypothetical protein
VQLARARLRHAERLADGPQRRALVVVQRDRAREARRQRRDGVAHGAEVLGGHEGVLGGRRARVGDRDRVAELVEARRDARVRVRPHLVVGVDRDACLARDLVVPGAPPEPRLGPLARAVEPPHARAEPPAQRVGRAHLVQHAPLDAARRVRREAVGVALVPAVREHEPEVTGAHEVVERHAAGEAPRELRSQGADRGRELAGDRVGERGEGGHRASGEALGN